MPRPAHSFPAVLVDVIGIVALAVAWNHASRLSRPWMALLLLGTALVALAAAALLTNRILPSLVLNSLAALIMPTGMGFILNLVMLALAVPAIALLVRHRASTPSTQPHGQQKP